MYEALFLAKKCITSFLVPPGIFVLVLLVSGLLLLRSRTRKIGVFSCVIALLLWLSSMTSFSEKLLSTLESSMVIPENSKGDVIVVLGGWAYGDARDISGNGALEGDTLARIVTAVRLEKKLKVPILVSGGAVFKDMTPEAQLMKRFLTDLGVPGKRIIVEDKSRDTIENARYSKELCAKYGYKKIVLVTSSYHMKRAIMAFKNSGVNVVPFPAYIRTREQRKYHVTEFLPSASAMLLTSQVVKEYIGLLFYKISP